MITHIFWDYNGTILDDVEVSVKAVNCMLKSRGLPPTDIETYRSTLTLPLDTYYESVGINGIPISELSVEFRKYCKQFSNLAHIFDGFTEIIRIAEHNSIKNILFSSLYHNHLIEELKVHNIQEYFTDVIGMTDLNVGSKLSNVKEYIKHNSIDVNKIVFIGDLTTDSDMAKDVGSRCILIPNGHNSKERCLSQGVEVYESLEQVKNYILNA